VLPPGRDSYDRLDKYFVDVSINRLLKYFDHQYVRRAVDEDKGWLRFGGIVRSELAEDTSTSKGKRRRDQG